MNIQNAPFCALDWYGGTCFRHEGNAVIYYVDFCKVGVEFIQEGQSYKDVEKMMEEKYTAKPWLNDEIKVAAETRRQKWLDFCKKLGDK